MRLVPLAVLLLVFPLFAQRYDDSITVNVVDVPVYVERFGAPIQGLTRDDFELFVDGAPQPIEYFDVLEQGGERPTVAAPTPAPVELKRRRLVVLLFDVGSSPRALHRSRAESVQFIGDGRFMIDLSGLADRLKSLEGVKHVVLLSERPGIQDAPRYFNAATRLHERYRAAGVILDAYTIRQEFRLDPGRYVAKALVRVAGTDTTGFRRTEFEVTAP